MHQSVLWQLGGAGYGFEFIYYSHIGGVGVAIIVGLVGVMGFRNEKPLRTATPKGLTATSVAKGETLSASAPPSPPLESWSQREQGAWSAPLVV